MSCNPYLNSRKGRRFDEDLDFIAQRFGKLDQFFKREITQASTLELGHARLPNPQKASGLELG